VLLRELGELGVVGEKGLQRALGVLGGEHVGALIGGEHPPHAVQGSGVDLHVKIGALLLDQPVQRLLDVEHALLIGTRRAGLEPRQTSWTKPQAQAPDGLARPRRRPAGGARPRP
jgi:hypothetical protein